MAQRCEICGKGPMTGSNISHAHNVTKRRWQPNLQRVRAVVDGQSEARSGVHSLYSFGQGHQGSAAVKSAANTEWIRRLTAAFFALPSDLPAARFHRELRIAPWPGRGVRRDACR